MSRQVFQHNMMTSVVYVWILTGQCSCYVWRQRDDKMSHEIASLAYHTISVAFGCDSGLNVQLMCDNTYTHTHTKMATGSNLTKSIVNPRSKPWGWSTPRGWSKRKDDHNNSIGGVLLCGRICNPRLVGEDQHDRMIRQKSDHVNDQPDWNPCQTCKCCP